MDLHDSPASAIASGTVPPVAATSSSARPVAAPDRPSDVLARHRVTEVGDPTGPALLLSHGFGGGQGTWARFTPHFPDHRVILFDHLGSGSTDILDFDHARHSSLTGYAEDVLAVCAALDLHGATFVGHSVSAMIGLLAAAAEPDRFSSLVLVAPSPRYVDDPDTGYVGGFTQADVDDLLTSLDSNYFTWSAAMAPVVMGTPHAPELGAELTRSFLGTHPDAARTFAHAIFLSDTRAVLPRVAAPVLVLQCRHDALAPEAVGATVAATLPAGRLVRLAATGHCPHVSAPEETARAVRRHLDDVRAGSAAPSRAASVARTPTARATAASPA